MGRDIIYGPQYWTANDIHVPLAGGEYHSSDHGGPDAPLSGYPEIAILENVTRRENTGPGGQHVLDAEDQNNYLLSNIVMLGLGRQGRYATPLTGHEFDCRGLHIESLQQIRTSVFSENNFWWPLVVVHGGANADGGVFTGNIFFEVFLSQTSGTAFTWNVGYRKESNTGATTMSNADHGSDITGAADTADDSYRLIEVTLQPSTITGNFPGTGFVSPASVTHNGSFSVVVDGVTVVSGSNLCFIVNPLRTTGQEHYLARGLWHGDG